jgi:hypothetical protein
MPLIEPEGLHPSCQSPPKVLPLWLDASEAETLVRLCVASVEDGGPDEKSLFLKLGTLVRAFQGSGATPRGAKRRRHRRGAPRGRRQ